MKVVYAQCIFLDFSYSKFVNFVKSLVPTSLL
jgi:hypothetical protein